MNPKKILIVAGEPSGDLHASNLVKDLKSMEEGLEFFGLGGALSREAGVRVIYDISKLALIGASEVLNNIFIVGRVYKNLIKEIDLEKPGLAILVDYPGFNLRLARELKKRSIPVVYYISPQVWAWGKGRIKIIKECVKLMIVFFEFEKALYKEHDIDVKFVGHPLLDIVKVDVEKDEVLRKYGLSKEARTIALLPGSRRSEVRALLPIMLAAAKIVKERLKDTQFVIAKYLGLPINLYNNAIKNSHLDIKVSETDTYNILAASDLAIVASGTATLESAIIETPLVIVYRANFFTYALYRLVRRTPHLGLMNIIAGKRIAPELVQYNATPRKIAAKAINILSEEGNISSMRAALKRVKSSLGTPGASGRAAKVIQPLLE